LAIGARHVTNDLAIGLRISLESAEKINSFCPKNQYKKVVKTEEEAKESKTF